jgi:hypothetical protein
MGYCGGVRFGSVNDYNAVKMIWHDHFFFNYILGYILSYLTC